MRSILVAAWAVLLLAGPGGARADPKAAAAMQARYALLKAGLGANAFDRPLHLESSETREVVRGEAQARTPDYLRVTLRADEGPMGTRDYRIVLEATRMEGGKTFVRLSYAYSYGVLASAAIQAYLGTLGRNKVGFTVTGKDSDGQPRHVAGMRGLVERNTMRYYLAIEAFLGSRSAAPGARTEKSLRDWFAAIEAYPRQLHEMERADYLAMKRREYSRQRSES